MNTSAMIKSDHMNEREIKSMYKDDWYHLVFKYQP
jgi:hypothetical protein